MNFLSLLLLTTLTAAAPHLSTKQGMPAYKENKMYAATPPPPPPLLNPVS